MASDATTIEALSRISRGGGVSADGLDMGSAVKKMQELHDKEDVSGRQKENPWMVRQFYNMVTDFYEYGWGASFHFAPAFKGENFTAATARYEHVIALKLGLKPGMKVLDLGCGVGGPAREIARFSGANITGCNINDYQLERLNIETKRRGLSHLVDSKKADFHNLPFADNSMDGIYQIEAYCHSTDHKRAYSEAFRVLKPGAYFAGYEWVLTEKFDPKNPEHLALKKGIEEGNGLADMFSKDHVRNAMVAAGFELLEAVDVSANAELPWYWSLAPFFSLKMFTYSRVGREAATYLVKALEFMKIAPKGSAQVNDMLAKTANALVRSGVLDVFIPCYLLVGRKPLTAGAAAAKK